MTRFVITKLCFWADACTVHPGLVLMHPRVRDDMALRKHELVHVEQMRLIGTITFWLWYWFSKSFRQDVEVEAYREQIKAGASAITCASHLTRYGLGITQSEALKLLEAK